jgi:hypothetical protein
MARMYRQLVQPIPGYEWSARSSATAAFALPSLPSDDFALPSVPSRYSHGPALDELAAAARRRKAALATRRPAPPQGPKALDAQNALYLAAMSFGVFIGTTLGLVACGLIGL